MASEHYIFSIYGMPCDRSRYFILRTVRSDFNNASQTQEDKCRETESASRLRLLEMIGRQNNTGELELVGEFHGYPEGDIFYSESGASDISVYYMATGFGKPWIIFGTAASEEDFLTGVENDEDLRTLAPAGEPVKISARFVTENELNFN
ncbi:hypothetical protein [Chryseobacterium hagamense]|uniref:Uncharacterized protein n=1 Tax=Chryseobacterium hagamense TaxID=395935 RepID=A0A511YQX8_9FLAO|nr:hypothetical protein [Chryseobacterium hagamense]GEN77607.1 hypothetical protein CHA01nite_33470 [Chryseobacterium hagamense]